MRGPRIAILTVQQHMQERWVTALQAALEAQGAAVELLDARSLTLSLDTPPAADVLVNRVSDAADPALCKFVRAYLQLMDVRGQRVVNGHRCYGIGASKVLHHAALQVRFLATTGITRTRFWFRGQKGGNMGSLCWDKPVLEQGGRGGMMPWVCFGLQPAAPIGRSPLTAPFLWTITSIGGGAHQPLTAL